MQAHGPLLHQEIGYTLNTLATHLYILNTHELQRREVHEGITRLLWSIYSAGLVLGSNFVRKVNIALPIIIRASVCWI